MATAAEDRFVHLRLQHVAHDEAYAQATHNSQVSLRQADLDRQQAKQAAHDMLLAQREAARLEAEAADARRISDAKAQEVRE